jgi:anti-sigma factor RsiW
MPENGDPSCIEVVELVTDYLEGCMADDARRRLEAHLADCSGCATYLAQMRTTIELTGRLRDDEIAPEVRAAVLDAFRAGSPG